MWDPVWSSWFTRITKETLSYRSNRNCLFGVISGVNQTSCLNQGGWEKKEETLEVEVTHAQTTFVWELIHL